MWQRMKKTEAYRYDDGLFHVTEIFDKISETIRGRRILLIDDICTTGATLRECVRVLRDNGAAAVLCLTVAKTPNNEKKEKNSQIASCNQGNTQV